VKCISNHPAPGGIRPPRACTSSFRFPTECQRGSLVPRGSLSLVRHPRSQLQLETWSIPKLFSIRAVFRKMLRVAAPPMPMPMASALVMPVHHSEVFRSQASAMPSRMLSEIAAPPATWPRAGKSLRSQGRTQFRRKLLPGTRCRAFLHPLMKKVSRSLRRQPCSPTQADARGQWRPPSPR
jgi:hypothetical protein